MRSYLQAIATLNFVGVVTLMAGQGWLIIPLIFTATTLFIDGISNHSKSKMSTFFMVGAPANFIGVMSGGLSGLTTILSLALVGSFFLLIGYLTE